MTAEPFTLPASDDRADSPVRIRLLGPLEIARVLTVPTSRMVRQVFVVLAVNAGKTVSHEDLTWELWDDHPPRSALSTRQSYIFALRRAGVIGTPAEWLRRAVELRPCGYALAIPPDQVDALRFVHLVTQARTRLESNDVRGAEDALRAGFSMWRGDPLEDIHKGPLLSAWVDGMVDSYRTAQALMFDLALRAGRHREVIDPLRQALRANPTREDFAAKLMTALARSQRRVEALQVYRDIRLELQSEHGINPGPELDRLQQQVLQGDKALEWTGEH